MSMVELFCSGSARVRALGTMALLALSVAGAGCAAEADESGPNDEVSDGAEAVTRSLKATHYDINAFGAPACGGPKKVGNYVAVGDSIFQGGRGCGKKVRVMHQGRSITLTVNNLCPECDGGGKIDLQLQGAWPAFKRLVTDQYKNWDGDIPVTVTF